VKNKAEIKNVICDYLFCFIGGIMGVAHITESLEIYKNCGIPECSQKSQWIKDEYLMKSLTQVDIFDSFLLSLFLSLSLLLFLSQI